MTFTHVITYQNRHGIHNLEWTVPKGWGEQAIRDAFHMQYTGAEIISITTPSKPS
jgi:hypothetical protein